MKTFIMARLALLAVIGLLLSSCSSTSLTNRWSDPEYSGPALNKILVIGIFKDETRRREFEEEFSKLISEGERVGITSYSVMPDLKAADKKEDVMTVVNKVGADGVMMVAFEGVSKEQREVPPSVDYVPTMGFGYGMYGYYGMGYSAVYRPGYTVTDKIVKLDIKMFDAKSEKMIWAGKSASFNPGSAQTVINELASLVIADMKKSGIVK
jgi:hypothetical protein